MQTKNSSTEYKGKKPSSKPCGTEQPLSDREKHLVEKLTMFYGVMGSPPELDGSLAYMAANLCKVASDVDISLALGRCTRECNFPVRLPHIIQRLPGLETPKLEAEMRKAWDVVIDFCQKYVQTDLEGRFAIDQGVRSTPPPILSDRIMDTIRRTGGWASYKHMTEESFPFQQRRFFDEYLAWSAVERIHDLSKLLTVPKVKQLAAAKQMPAPKPQTSTTIQASQPAKVLNKIPEPMTDVEIADRRQILKQQVQTILDLRTSPAAAAD